MNEWISSTSEALENFAFKFQKKCNKQTNVHASSKQNEDCVTVVYRKVSLQRNANFTILRINNQNYR